MRLKFIVTGIVIVAGAAGAQTPQAPAKSKAPSKAEQSPAGYKKELPAKLLAKAKVAEAAAAASALAKVPGGKINGVELEEEDGKLIYSYDIKVAGKAGIEEIHVDAITGAVIKSEHEDAAAEKKEADQDKKGAKKPAVPATKKP